MSVKNSFVEVKTVTWSKDSHGLFDYESKNVQYSKIRIEQSSKVFKTGNDILIKNTQENAISENEKFLFSVQSHQTMQDQYYLNPTHIKDLEENPQNQSFLIVRSLKDNEGCQKGYKLSLGDVIRLGRIEYRVLEFRDNSRDIQSLLADNVDMESQPFSLLKKECSETSDDQKRQCRICLMDEQESQELLVNPCHCKGTSEYIHIKCLQDWISSKAKKKVNPSATCIYWKKLHCEICKVPLPDLVQVGEQTLELVAIYRPETPYILLERVFYDKSRENTKNTKTMILLSVSNETEYIKLGRGHECDLRENDISVSRLHAFIRFHNGEFLITDNNSKFGTLVLLRKDYELERKKIALQIGRTVVTFSLKSHHSEKAHLDQIELKKVRKELSALEGDANSPLIAGFPQQL